MFFNLRTKHFRLFEYAFPSCFAIRQTTTRAISKMAVRRRGAFWQPAEDKLLFLLDEMDAGAAVMPSTYFPNLFLI